ncbi:uncharacterized protein BO97DRAFT_428055 [Aspergillus homomorphus CBS 101889]|uniref:Uncharacterized protein n=1 Tax=Aspergillus homomorphus (strain CBS 101889) TaxID=1450537 RepID=A0A395HLD7_ASPHC|nr:hypothetical protein BO97DRAFT_428055 [Aspergillus homomorphus CBS 101889]RAL08741.1 hypothetical protein BO97DRAFT_428055 [Aspergillus homomorphus CBS 101889]
MSESESAELFTEISAALEQVNPGLSAGGGSNPVISKCKVDKYICPRVTGVGEPLCSMKGDGVEFIQGRIRPDNVNHKPIIEAILIQSRGIRPVRPCTQIPSEERKFPVSIHVPNKFRGICGNCKASDRKTNCEAMEDGSIAAPLLRPKDAWCHLLFEPRDSDDHEPDPSVWICRRNPAPRSRSRTHALAISNRARSLSVPSKTPAALNRRKTTRRRARTIETDHIPERDASNCESDMQRPYFRIRLDLQRGKMDDELSNLLHTDVVAVGSMVGASGIGERSAL